MQRHPSIIPTAAGNTECHRPMPHTVFAYRTYVDQLYHELLGKIEEGVPSAGSVRYDAAQTLTELQKAQARTNIGAISSLNWGSIGGTVSNQTDLVSYLTSNFQPVGSYATLVNGVIPVANIPASVYDVLEFANRAAFPASGSSGKLYVATSDNTLWRWNGTTYVQMNSFTETLTGVKVNNVDLPITSGKVNIDLTGCADVLDFANRAAFPQTGSTGKIYVATDVNGLYRWNGTTYVQLNAGGSGGISTVKVDGVALSVVDGAVDITGKQDNLYIADTSGAVALKIGTVTVGRVLRYWRDTNFTFSELEIYDDSGHSFAEGFEGSYAFSDNAGWTQSVAGTAKTVSFSKTVGTVTLTDTVSGVTQQVVITPTYPAGPTSSTKAYAFGDQMPTTGHDDRFVSSGGVRDALDLVHVLYGQNAAAASKNALDILSNLALITALSGRTYTKSEEDGLLLAKQARLLVGNVPIAATVDSTPTPNSLNLVTSGGVYAAIAGVPIPSVPVKSVKVNGNVLTPDASGAVDVTVPAAPDVPVKSVKVNGNVLTPDASGAVNITGVDGQWTFAQIPTSGGTINGNRTQAYCTEAADGTVLIVIPRAISGGVAREFGLTFAAGFMAIPTITVVDEDGNTPSAIFYARQGGWTYSTLSSLLTDALSTSSACSIRVYECAPGIFSAVEYY